MAKRIKNSIRSKRSGLKLESLEQRQLLASIVAGSGTEVDTDVEVVRADGSSGVYDQILLTGSTITVTADAGQVTRVDFLDTDGDIVRAEFSGSGTLTISLDDFSAASTPEGYATETQYVMGHASFRIEGSNETTNFSVHSLGTANVHDGAANPIFDNGNKTGGDNNTADVARVVIESSGGALGNAFGGIRAGNAVFSDDSGAVGIVAPNIQFQGPIIIGDIDAKGNAIAVLQIGQFSANKTVQIAGGDLKQTVGDIDDSNVDKIVSSSGQTSMGVLLSTQAIDDGVFSSGTIGATDVSYTSSAAKVVIDGKTATQAELDEYKNMYLNEVVFQNGLAKGLVFSARLIGDVTVEGDLAGVITTDSDRDTASEDGEFGIGDVTITGKILGTGAIQSATSLGDVTVEKGIDLTTGDAAVGTLISTIGRASQSSAIGAVSFGTADVKLSTDDVTLVASGTGAGAASGGIASVSGALLDRDGGANATIWSRTGNIGNITFTKAIDIAGTGKFVDADAGSVGAINGLTLNIAGAIEANKGVGAISSTGTGNSDHVVLGDVTSTTESIGTISSSKNVTLSGDLTAAKAIGAITAGGSLTTAGTITATDGALGAITAGGTVTIGGDIAADSIGSITVNGKNSDLLVNAVVSTDKGAIGDISVNGEDADIIFTGTGAFSAKTAIGNVTVADGVITGTDNTVEFSANKIGDVSVTGNKDKTTTLLTDVIFSAAGSDKASVESAVIGDITLKANNATASIAGSTTAAVDADSGVGFSSSGNIGDVSITSGGENGKLLASATSGFVIRAGSSAMGAGYDLTNAAYDTADEQYAVGLDANAGVSIGDVTISASLTGLGNNAAGTGLVIAAGVNATTGGIFVSADANAVSGAAKLGTSNIGDVTIENLAGSSIAGFSSGNLDNGDGFTAGSVIIADKIASINVTTAVGVETITPTGLPLKGAILAGGAAEDADDLYVIVL